MRRALALALLAALAACGYRTGLVPRDAHGAPAPTLGFEVFHNESRLPDLERPLHAAMSRAATSWVDARLVRPEAARLVVRGTILDVLRQPGVRTGRNEVLESREVVVVEAELYDPRADEVLRRSVAQVAVGTTLDTPAAGVDARRRAVDVAADRLVLLLLAAGDDPRAEAAEALAPVPGSGETP